jgi:hypothetical protein
MLIGLVSPVVLGKIRLPLFRKRSRTLFGFVGLQKNVQPVFRQQRETALVVCVGVERVL